MGKYKFLPVFFCSFLHLSFSQVTDLNVRTQQESLMKRTINPAVNPCDNFYEYACGNWNKVHPIPEHRTKYNVQDLLDEQKYEKLNDLLTSTTKKNLNSVNFENKVVNFYKSCLDTQKIEEQGVTPLLELLESFGGWPVLKPDWTAPENFDWLELSAKLFLYNVEVLLGGKIANDFSDSSKNILYIIQPTFSLLSGNSENKIRSVLEVLGVQADTANQAAKNIVEFERNLRNVTDELPYRNMEIFTASDLSNQNSSLNWLNYLKILTNSENVPADTKVVIGEPSFVSSMSTFVNQQNTSDVVNYMLWCLVDKILDSLDHRFQKIVDTHNAPISSNMPRWKFCVEKIVNNMDMALSSLYARNLNVNIDQIKNEVRSMLSSIKSNFVQLFTRADAVNKHSINYLQQKVNAMVSELSSGDFLLNDTVMNEMYKTININADKYFENIMSLTLFTSTKKQQELRNEDDPYKLRELSVSKFKAYDLNIENTLVSLVGVLKPPYFDVEFPKFLKYGGLGFILSHEIMHGLLKTGRYFDSHGNFYLRSLLSNSAEKNIFKMEKCLKRQNKINEADLRETFADNVGIKIAYKAYRNWLTAHQDQAQNEFVNGLNLTSTQLFFLSDAQNWCETLKPEGVQHEIEKELHVTSKQRVNGRLRNLKKFAFEFNCPSGSAMNPVKKCRNF